MSDETKTQAGGNTDEWTAKKGKYIHENGCGAGPDEPCTCEFPYPKRKLSPKDRIVREWRIEVIGRWRLWRGGRWARRMR